MTEKVAYKTLNILYIERKMLEKKIWIFDWSNTFFVVQIKSRMFL